MLACISVHTPCPEFNNDLNWQTAICIDYNTGCYFTIFFQTASILCEK